MQIYYLTMKRNRIVMSFFIYLNLHKYRGFMQIYLG